MAIDPLYYNSGGGIAPAASPVNTGVFFPTVPAPAIDLTGLLDELGSVQKHHEYEVAKQQEAQRQAEVEAAKAARAMAEGFVPGKEGALSGSQEEFAKTTQASIQKMRDMGFGQAAIEEWQAHVAGLAGEAAVNDKYRSALMALKPQYSVVVGPDGQEVAPGNPQDAMKQAWDQTVASSYALTTAPGAAGALKAKDTIDKEFLHEVDASQAKSRETYGVHLQTQKYFDMGRAILDIPVPTENDWAMLRGNVVDQNSKDKFVGSNDPRMLVINGLGESLLRYQDPNRVLAALPHIADIKLANGLRIGDDNDGAVMIDKVRIAASAEKKRLDDQELDNKVRSEKAGKVQLREDWFGTMQDELAKGRTRFEVEALVQEDINNRDISLRGALTQELQEMLTLTDKQSSARGDSIYDGLLKTMGLGEAIDDDLASSIVRGSVSGAQFRDLIEKNRELKNVDKTLKDTTYQSTRKQLEDIVRDTFQGQESGSTFARAQLQPVLDRYLGDYDKAARSLAKGGDPVKLNEYFAKQLEPDSGFSKEIRMAVTNFQDQRKRLLAEIQPGIEKGVDQKAKLNGDEARLYLGDMRDNLLKENDKASDPTRLIATGENRALRREAFQARVARSLQGGTELAPLRVLGGKELPRDLPGRIANQVYTDWLAALTEAKKGDASGADIEEAAAMRLNDLMVPYLAAFDDGGKDRFDTDPKTGRLIILPKAPETVEMKKPK